MVRSVSALWVGIDVGKEECPPLGEGVIVGRRARLLGPGLALHSVPILVGRAVLRGRFRLAFVGVL